jgi:hypothetical protein
VGDGFFSGGLFEHRHLLPISRATPDAIGDGSLFIHRKAGCHGEVFFSCLTTGKLRDKRMVGGLALSGDETTGGIFVKSMNDAWAVFSREFAELSIAVMQQSIDECAAEVARTGMNNKSARFVDDNDVLVFEQDRNGNIFGKNFSRFRFGSIDGNYVSFGESMSRFHSHSINENSPIFDPLLQSGTGNGLTFRLQGLGKKPIKAKSGAFTGNDNIQNDQSSFGV